MAFWRQAGKTDYKESILFGHWTIVLQLLKIGIDWEAIQQFTEDEINLILGVEMAIQQKQADEQAREMAKSNMSSRMGGF